MAQNTNPVFTDVGAYARPTPGAPQVANAAPAYESAGEVAQAGMRLAKVFIEQDQDKAVLDAKLGMAEGFAQLRQKVAQTTDPNTLNQTFDEESAKIEVAAQSLAKDQKTAQMIGAEFRASAISTKADVTKRMFALRGSEYLAAADTLAESLYQNAPLDDDPHLTASKAQIIQQRDNMVKLGYLDAHNGQKWGLGNLRRLDDGRATWDVKNAPQFALEALQANKDGEWLNYTDLDVKRREVLISMAKAGSGREQHNVNEYIMTMNENIVTGKGTGQAELNVIRKLGTPTQVADAEGKYKAATDMYAQVQIIKNSPIGEQERLMQEFSQRTADGKPGYQYYAPYAHELKRRVDKSNQEMGTDFASWAFDNFAPSKDFMKDATIEDRATWVQGVASQKGVLAGFLLPKEEAANIGATYRQSPPDAQQAIAKQVMKDSGRFAPQVLDQLLAKGDGGGKVPFSFAAMLEVDSHTASRIGAAEKMKVEDLKKFYANDSAANDVMNSARAKFDAEIGRTIPSASPEARKGWQDTYVKLALHSRDPEGSYKDLFSKSHIVNYGSVSARIPKGMQPYQKDKVMATAEYLLKRPNELGTITDIPNVRLASTALQVNGGWMTYNDPNDGQDAGLQLYYNGRPALDTKGQEIKRSWVDLMDYKPQDEADWRLARGKYRNAEPTVKIVTPADIQEVSDRARREATGAKY